MKEPFLSNATLSLNPFVLSAIRELQPGINVSGLVRDLLVNELSRLKDRADECQNKFNNKVY